MVLNVDPDRPDIPSIARILSGMGVLCLLGSVTGMFLALSGYEWVNDRYAMVGAVAAFLLALVFIGQAKTIELLAVVSARVKSRFAIDAIAKAQQVQQSAEKKPAPITQPPKERIIHVPDDQAREQGFRVR